jgi:hexosaminidase
MNNQYPRLDFLHVNYHIPLPEGPANVEAFVDTISLSFTTSQPIKMVYTTDGSEPVRSSTAYNMPIHLNKSTIVKIRTVLPTGELGTIRTVKAMKEGFTPGMNAVTKPGLLLRNAPGLFFSAKDLDTVRQWSDSIIYDLKTHFNYQHPSACVITGYIDIVKSGVIYFSTNVEQFWLNNTLLIDNQGEVKNHSRNDASIALAKGKHAIKIIFLNNIVGGRPAAINGIRIFYRYNNDQKYRLVDASILTH